MGSRFCPRCRAEVEDVDGFCLLGHPLRLEAPRDSLSHLRAEVDRAFEQAEVEIADVLQTVEIGASTATHPIPPPPPARPNAFAALEISEGEQKSDPLDQFAPAARMDWGPERPSLLRRRGN